MRQAGPLTPTHWRFASGHPYYLTPLAWSVYALIAVVLLLLSARLGQRLRERKLLARQQVLAEQVAERTAEVRAQAREIRQIRRCPWPSSSPMSRMNCAHR